MGGVEGRAGRGRLNEKWACGEVTRRACAGVLFGCVFSLPPPPPRPPPPPPLLRPPPRPTAAAAAGWRSARAPVPPPAITASSNQEVLLLEVKIEGGGRAGQRERSSNLRVPSLLITPTARVRDVPRRPHPRTVCGALKKKEKKMYFKRKGGKGSGSLLSAEPRRLLPLRQSRYCGFNTTHEPPGHQSIVPRAPLSSLSLSPSSNAALLLLLLLRVLSSSARCVNSRRNSLHSEPTATAVKGKSNNKKGNRNSVLSPQSASQSADAGERKRKKIYWQKNMYIYR